MKTTIAITIALLFCNVARAIPLEITWEFDTSGIGGIPTSTLVYEKISDPIKGIQFIEVGRVPYPTAILAIDTQPGTHIYIATCANDRGQSGFSNEASITVLAPVVKAPGAPKLKATLK